MGNKEKGRHLLDTNLALKLYNMGLTDKEIAHCCGVDMSNVCRWRHVHGLRYNREGEERAMGAMEQLTIDAVEARRLGMTYGQYMAQKAFIKAAERNKKN